MAEIEQAGAETRAMQGKDTAKAAAEKRELAPKKPDPRKMGAPTKETGELVTYKVLKKVYVPGHSILKPGDTFRGRPGLESDAVQRIG